MFDAAYRPRAMTPDKKHQQLLRASVVGVLAACSRGVEAWSLASRRSWLRTSIGIGSLVVAEPSSAGLTTQASAEYTNSITASRDTNISPKEAYDTILQYVPKGEGRALDLGAGAGLSTSYLYRQGYTTIDAVDWSRDAWDRFVVDQPDSVRFYQATDDGFLQGEDGQSQRYQIIVYNFAVNPAKAQQVARQHLAPNGRLLAPVNDQTDYWYKQTYWVLDAQGQLLTKSPPEVGAWSVQFQPDVTSPSCTGIWCGNMNGFLQQQKR